MVYEVKVYYSGSETLYVQADDESEACTKALEKAEKDGFDGMSIEYDKPEEVVSASDLPWYVADSFEFPGDVHDDEFGCRDLWEHDRWERSRL